MTHGDFADDGPEALIDRAAAVGVERIVCVAFDIPSCEEVTALARDHETVDAVVGIHPHEADRFTTDDLARVEELAGRDEVVAVGETGLDFFRRWSDPERQRSLFRSHLELASRVGKPVVIHDREAHDEVVSILREHAGNFPGGVLHCFSGDIALLEAVLPLGFYISIPGTVTFRKNIGGVLDDVIRACPADRLLVETDCPWLTPVPHRGKRNEPAYVRFTAARVAEVLGIEAVELDTITTGNTLRLFHSRD